MSSLVSTWMGDHLGTCKTFNFYFTVYQAKSLFVIFLSFNGNLDKKTCVFHGFTWCFQQPNSFIVEHCLSCLFLSWLTKFILWIINCLNCVTFLVSVLHSLCKDLIFRKWSHCHPTFTSSPMITSEFFLTCGMNQSSTFWLFVFCIPWWASWCFARISCFILEGLMMHLPFSSRPSSIDSSSQYAQ